MAQHEINNLATKLSKCKTVNILHTCAMPFRAGDKSDITFETYNSYFINSVRPPAYGSYTFETKDV